MNDEDKTRDILLSIFAVLVIVLIIYNIYTGLTVKKIGIPGIFEIEFGNPIPYPTPAPTIPAPTPTPTFLKRISGNYNLISWVEAPSPYTLYIDVKSGTLNIDTIGDASWQLVLQPRGQVVTPTPGIKCGGRVSISSQQLEGVPGGGKNVAYDWPSDFNSVYYQIWLTFCGWNVGGGRAPFSLYLDESSTGKKILEMRNINGTFTWSR